MSPGKIFENSWGNVPPGEAFCCPDISSVNGTICINGSLPNFLLFPDEEVVCKFIKGKLIKWQVEKNSKAERYFNEISEDAKHKNDENWNSFAEFGIGLNPAIKKLVGESLFDEKMAGTIHIAIGDNKNFGHGISSYYHDDLVCIKPTVILDDITIIKLGKLNLLEIKKWKRNCYLNQHTIKDKDIIMFNNSKVATEAGCIYRLLSKGDRKGKIKIGYYRDGQLYSRIKNYFTERDEIRFSDLQRRFRKNEKKSFIRFMNMLLHYKIASIK
jgi:Thermophilic metalloprotease (M29)